MTTELSMASKMNSILRSVATNPILAKRSTSNPSVSVSTNERAKDFTLNVDRTIAKQLQATKREACVE